LLKGETADFGFSGFSGFSGVSGVSWDFQDFRDFHGIFGILNPLYFGENDGFGDFENPEKIFEIPKSHQNPESTSEISKIPKLCI